MFMNKKLPQDLQVGFVDRLFRQVLWVRVVGMQVVQYLIVKTLGKFNIDQGKERYRKALSGVTQDLHRIEVENR